MCVCVLNKMTCTYLWTEVHNIVQEVANKTIPKKNKSKTAKPLRRLYEWRKKKEKRKAGREGKVHPIKRRLSKNS